MKASIRAKVEHLFRIISDSSASESQIQGVAENDNQLAMLFTLANLFRADQMIRQWRDSLKLGINALNGEEQV